MAHEGVSLYRLKQNPREQVFHTAWKAEQKYGSVLEYILGNGNEKAVLTDRDEQVAATVIQWLGSPVGQHFLTEAQATGDGVMVERIIATMGR